MMMKKALAIVFTLVLLLSCFPAVADDGYAGSSYYGATATLLSGLTHNCKNTGIMLPEGFSPYQTTYLLTVASWVTKPRFTPVAFDPNATITVNGKAVRSGQQSDYIPINDKPKAVEIVVSNGGASTTYTIYIQRRPSEKRTRVSVGYINSIHLKGTTWKIDADLVSIQYSGDDYNSGNWSTFTNKTKEVGVYDYNVAPHCVFYYGSKDNCYRAHNVSEFMNNYLNYGSSLYTFVYIEDEIVAVFPYGADY